MFTEATLEFKVQGVREELAGLEQWLAKAAQEGTAAHEVERHLFRQVLALGANLRTGSRCGVGPSSRAGGC